VVANGWHFHHLNASYILPPLRRFGNLLLPSDNAYNAHMTMKKAIARIYPDIAFIWLYG